MSVRFPFHIWCLGIWDTCCKYKDQTRQNRFSGVRDNGGGGQAPPLSGGEAPELMQIKQIFFDRILSYLSFLHMAGKYKHQATGYYLIFKTSQEL